MKIAEILDIRPYSLNKTEKEQLLNSCFTELSRYHYVHCLPYRKMMDSINYDINKDYSYYDLPFLPVRLFKMFDLYSVKKEEIIKTMTSSGTSGQAVSKIYLDRETSSNQTKVLTKIVSSFIGKQRIPMIIIDSETVVKDRNLFSARGAGILGFSMFGTKRIYALNEQMHLNIELLREFIDNHKNERIFLFGFTFMVYQHFYQELLKKEIKLDLSNAVLIHGGGWKKLISQAVTSNIFKSKLNEVCGIKHVHDYYGMVEQTGTVYMECECGHLHAPVFSDVIMRRAMDFSPADFGEKGIIQVISILPQSYPGHSLLTEDEGILLGEDDCLCGRKGKYFKITGRLKNAEIRGCSDTYATRF
ncbi:MAG: acyl-protein synthetase [Prevotellaceae bacterium]|jgi:phenylacetate-coenzyme A ligase PaaK-like adenylate-forming protein|nr:acyl-protein synthetase [Prevotellaceae bacterium]